MYIHKYQTLARGLLSPNTQLSSQDFYVNKHFALCDADLGSFGAEVSIPKRKSGSACRLVCLFPND